MTSTVLSHARLSTAAAASAIEGAAAELSPTPPVALTELQSKLLDALPAARHVLVVGGAQSPVVDAYEVRHPGVTWRRGAGDGKLLQPAAASCDLVLMPAGLDDVEDPLSLLKSLATHCPAGVPLFVCFDGPSGKPAPGSDSEPVSAADHAAQARRGSRAALCKLLMDAGWMPDVADHTVVADPEGTADDPAANRPVDGIVIEARRCFDALMPESDKESDIDIDKGTVSRFAVVVPTTRTHELQLNVEISPGLRELNAPIYAIRNATSPGDAMDTALAHFDHDWVLLCHQDVYFPETFGHRLNDLLATIPADQRRRTLIGFVGKAVDTRAGGFTSAGFAIDRLHRIDHPESAAAVSVDELALVVSRDSIHRIDPEMGWHLWATDLCLAAICTHEVLPRIVRLPLFHNSSNDSELTTDFHASCARLMQKYPDFGPIPTLCGTIHATPPATVVAATPIAAPTAPKARVCCICNQPVDRWLPHSQIAARSEFMKLVDAVGSDLSVYQCPSCHSTDRDRHLWRYMNAVGLIERMSAMKVLHIAPERHIETLIESLNPLRYVRGDLHPQRADHIPLDVESLDFNDASFDLIICNHVLEHVASPARALAEFNRCLGHGGLLIAQTPYAPSLKHTFELNRPTSPAFARLFYGQGDHVRLFGADIVDRFHEAGFSGDLLPHHIVLSGVDEKAYGCNAREPFFCFSK